MKETIIGTRIGCQYGHALQDGISVLVDEITATAARKIPRLARGKMAATSELSGMEQQRRLAELDGQIDALIFAASENETRLSNAQKILGSCAVCAGYPEQAPSEDFTCPAAMELINGTVTPIEVTGRYGIKI